LPAKPVPTGFQQASRNDPYMQGLPIHNGANAIILSVTLRAIAWREGLFCEFANWRQRNDFFCEHDLYVLSLVR
jgi:hypothetical protein